jgi:hypothetical protein
MGRGVVVGGLAAVVGAVVAAVAVAVAVVKAVVKVLVVVAAVVVVVMVVMAAFVDEGASEERDGRTSRRKAGGVLNKAKCNSQWRACARGVGAWVRDVSAVVCREGDFVGQLSCATNCHRLSRSPSPDSARLDSGGWRRRCAVRGSWFVPTTPILGRRR